MVISRMEYFLQIIYVMVKMNGYTNNIAVYPHLHHLLCMSLTLSFRRLTQKCCDNKSNFEAKFNFQIKLCDKRNNRLDAQIKRKEEEAMAFIQSLNQIN